MILSLLNDFAEVESKNVEKPLEDKMKISFYINQMKVGGGAERVISRLANYLCNRYYITVITIVRDTEEYYLDERVKRVVLDEMIEDRRADAVRRIFALRKYCKIYKPEVLIAFAEGASEFAIIATILTKQKVIISLRNAPEHDFPRLRSKLLARTLLPLADGAVFQTKKICEWYPLKIREKAEIIFNPIDSRVYNYEWEPIKNRIVSIGRLTVSKNHRILIGAFSRIISVYPDAELYIYGCGDQKNTLIA